MNKRYLFYKVMLTLLRGLVFAKRGLFFVLSRVWKGLIKVNNLYKKTLGFYIYKISFHVGKFIRKHILLHKYSTFEILGRRGSIQVFLLVIMLVIMIPQSKLYSKEHDSIPGHKTILYKVVGPGEQDFDLEEIISETVDTELETIQSAWKEGAIVLDQPAESIGVEMETEPQDLTGISAGGHALTKPIIAPGADLETVAPGSEQVKRSRIVQYEVQPGDVVSNIAKRYGIDVETILWANGLSARSYIRPGDSLKILPIDGVLHTVKRGDTISAISKKYKAEQDQVIAFNRLQSDGSDIVVGEELVVPDGRKPQARYVATRTTSKTFSRVVAPPPSVNAPAGQNYIWPSAARIITQYYGWRHTGLDVAGKSGSAIYAAKSGRIIKSKCGWNGGYGCYIIIDHGNGVHTLYAHNRTDGMYVSVGQQVSQGETIALMGSTGRSTGPHLHFEVRVNGRKQNPLRYVRR